MYRNLFVPVDGSPLSLRAMAASIALAKQLGAAITGFVVEPDAPMPMEGSPLPAILISKTYLPLAKERLPREADHF